MISFPVDNFGTVVGENPDCLLLTGTVVGENPDHVCWVIGRMSVMEIKVSIYSLVLAETAIHTTGTRRSPCN